MRSLVSLSSMSFVWVKAKKKKKIPHQILKEDTGLNPFFFLFAWKVCRVQTWKMTLVILQVLSAQNKLWESCQNQILPLEDCIDIKKYDIVDLITSVLMALFAVAWGCSGTMLDFLDLSSSLQRKFPTSFSSNIGVLTLKWDINHNVQDRFLSPLPSCKTNVAFYNIDSEVST